MSYSVVMVATLRSARGCVGGPGVPASPPANRCSHCRGKGPLRGLIVHADTKHGRLLVQFRADSALGTLATGTIGLSLSLMSPRSLKSLLSLKRSLHEIKSIATWRTLHLTRAANRIPIHSVNRQTPRNGPLPRQWLQRLAGGDAGTPGSPTHPRALRSIATITSLSMLCAANQGRQQNSEAIGQSSDTAERPLATAVATEVSRVVTQEPPDHPHTLVRYEVSPPSHRLSDRGQACTSINPAQVNS